MELPAAAPAAADRRAGVRASVICAFRLALVVGAAAATGCAIRSPHLPGWLPLVHPIRSTAKSPTLFAEPFDALEPARWKEVEVKGRTAYTIEELDGSRVLKAHSQGGASILLSPFRFDPQDYPWLSWRWRVDRFAEGEALERKEGSDAAARIYVYFETPGLPWQKRNLDYVWSAVLPAETMLASAFSPSSKILVVESGPTGLGQWRSVTRNIPEDYRRGFGKEAPDVVAIGIMTDTDTTQSEAIAFFDDIMITRQPPTAAGAPASPVPIGQSDSMQQGTERH